MKINDISVSTVNNAMNETKNSSSASSKETEASVFNKETGSVFAGNLNLGNDTEEKKKKAQSMAMDLMKDVFENDLKTDSEIQSRDDNIRKLYDENQEAQDMISNIEAERAITKEGYGIMDESQEEKDLNLLRKERDSKTDISIILTDEEKTELERIHNNGITAYQKQMLDMDDSELELKNRIEDNKKQIFEDSAVIKDIKINRLKTHEMVDARKQGDKIIASANKEIMGDIVQTGLEKADENMEEIEETKEKYEEIQEKYEEYLDNKKEKEEEMEDMYELSQEYTKVRTDKQASTLPDTKKSINQIINELSLTIDDIKGAVVDTDV